MVRQSAQGGCDWSREVTGDPLQLASANYFTRIVDAQWHAPSCVRFQVLVRIQRLFETVSLLGFDLRSALGLSLRIENNSMQP